MKGRVNYMNIFELARLELIREGKAEAKNADILLLKRAEVIRHYLDISVRNKNVLRRRYSR